MAAAATDRINFRSLLGSAESMLLGTTALSKDSTFNFGVAKARQSAPKTKASPMSTLVKGIEFTIAGARSRIKEFLNGDFAPKALDDLRDYLASKKLSLETHRSRDGSVANYLVDAQTKQALLASTVDRRLSRPGIARMFGKSIEAEAENVRRRTTRSPEQVIAHVLRNQSAGILLSADAARSPFRDWDDMTFMVPAMFDGREMAMQGDDLWIGNVLAVASEDPDENLEIVRKAREEGRQVIFPAATRADAETGRFTPGMPILLRDGAVRMHMIDPRLSSNALAVEFGSTLRDRYMTMKTRFSGKMKELSSRSQGAEVLDLATFRKQFARQKPRPVVQDVQIAQAVAAPQLRRTGGDHLIRHEIGDDGRERMIVVDRRTGSEGPFHPDTIPAGRYPKEDGFGLPAGFLVVDAEGGYSHLDQQDRFHNSMGPAIVPPPGTTEPTRYALNGAFRDAPAPDGVQRDDLDGRKPAYRN